jgi:hypothetical protein
VLNQDVETLSLPRREMAGILAIFRMLVSQGVVSAPTGGSGGAWERGQGRLGLEEGASWAPSASLALTFACLGGLRSEMG